MCARRSIEGTIMFLEKMEGHFGGEKEKNTDFRWKEKTFIIKAQIRLHWVGLGKCYLELLERDSGAMNPDNQSHYMRHHWKDATGSDSHLVW